MIRIAALCVYIFVLTVNAAGAADFAARPGRVSDGDTITIRLRSQGIDAPELRQRCEDGAGRCYGCGRAARDAFRAVLGRANVSIKVWETDRYGRPVVTLFADGKDAHLELLREGHAVAYRRYLPAPLKASYLAAEAEAKAARRGIWAGAFVKPDRWRRGDRLTCEHKREK